jgi:two-component system, OmpR family, response regulator
MTTNVAVTDVKKILVVEDDAAIRNLIQRFLGSKPTYEVKSVGDGKSAIASFKEFDPDLVILDINLPDSNGYQLCRDMQAATNVCVLMLTSSTDQASKLRLLAEGADDYMTKPFDLEELAVRVDVVLRRMRERTSLQEKSLVFGTLAIDPPRREVKLNGENVKLTALEFNLLHFLASHPGRVWTRVELIREVWGHEFVGDPRVVDVHIGQIRSHIEADTSQPTLIHTVRGVGYKFEAPDGEHAAIEQGSDNN